MRKGEAFVIEPYVAAGRLRFGMAVDEVRRVLGAPVTPFRKGERPTDAFDTLAVHVFYDDDGCAAVEFFEGADPVLDGLHLLESDYGAVERALAARDAELRLQLDGFVSFARGVGVSADPERPAARARSAIAFRRGYYDGSMAALARLARR